MPHAEQGRDFVSGNEAVALGVRLAAPAVVAAYPITPQTIVVERLAEMVEDGSLKTEFMHVESEHSAISAVMGAAALGVRTFTATSSQGLLYMAEGLHYASGGRFPLVMMNACRSVALPWSIFGDQRDALSQLDSGWIQLFVEDAQEALDTVLQAYRVAEDPSVLTPVMVNLDGFLLTHTYETVSIPTQEQVDAYLPAGWATPWRMDLQEPRNMAFSSSPRDNQAFKYQQQEAMLRAMAVLEESNTRFAEVFGRPCGGLLDPYRCEGARVVLLALGSVCGTIRDVVDGMRAEGHAVGMLRIRSMRPFPVEALRRLLAPVEGYGVLDRAISFGFEGTVCSQVRAALADLPKSPWGRGFVAGLGGRSITARDIRGCFERLLADAGAPQSPRAEFIQVEVKS